MSINPPPPTETVHIFLLAGQSNCVGKARIDLLLGDDKYPEYHKEQSGVWFSGRTWNDDDFFIKPMEVNQDNLERGTFGPEVSLGYTYHRIMNKPVMIIKTGAGGTDVYRQWNPYTEENQWNRDEDDGTSAFLQMNDESKLLSKNHMYKRLVYQSRLAMEALKEADVPFVLKGLFWVQGEADKARTWQDFGADTANLWKAIRHDIGRPNGAPDLPIVDSGGTGYPNTRAGKEHARELICDINVSRINVEAGVWDVGPVMRGKSKCVPGRRDDGGCSYFVNIPLFNKIGWDPAVLELKPYSESNDYSLANKKTFHFYRDYPRDMHSEYEKMILEGKLTMNTYIQTFEPQKRAVSAAEMNPEEYSAASCPDGEYPSSKNICWGDMRTLEKHQEVMCDPVFDPNLKFIPAKMWQRPWMQSRRFKLFEVFLLLVVFVAVIVCMKRRKYQNSDLRTTETNPLRDGDEPSGIPIAEVVEVL